MDESSDDAAISRRVREFELARRPASVGVLNGQLADWLPSFGIPDATLHAVLVCCDELVANACQHAGTTGGPIGMRIEVMDRGMLIGCSYRARDFDLSAHRSPQLHTPVSLRDIGGLGLHLMYALCQRCDYRFHDDHHHITLEWRWSP
ncbi:MAG TPA: ATP-binding protein [Patescibacteria group bacterium]|nr:ATP-binding protein [Patescibacteria group bacterium]